MECITYSCPSFNCGLTKPPLKLGHEWVFIYDCFPFDVITYPCSNHDVGQTSLLVKEAPVWEIDNISIYYIYLNRVEVWNVISCFNQLLLKKFTTKYAYPRGSFCTNNLFLHVFSLHSCVVHLTLILVADLISWSLFRAQVFCTSAISVVL